MRRRRRIPLHLFIGMTILLIILFVWRMAPVLQSPSPTQVVEQFYEYEQEGDFGSAWELFHPTMQQRFSKSAYVTERSHIYMSHYAVTTFSFDIVESKKLKKWKMKNTNKSYQDVQHVQIKQIFNSKFGIFTVLQDVYVVKEKDEWQLVWEFK